MTGIVRESAYGGGTLEDRSTINFGGACVQAPDACEAAECFIHCAMPLGLLARFQNSLKLALADAIITLPCP